MNPAVRLAERSMDDGPHSPPDAPERGRRRGRVLCGDNRASCNLAAVLLSRAGYEVVNANSLPRAPQRIGGEPFDLRLINHEVSLTCGVGGEE